MKFTASLAQRLVSELHYTAADRRPQVDIPGVCGGRNLEGIHCTALHCTAAAVIHQSMHVCAAAFMGQTAHTVMIGE